MTEALILVLLAFLCFADHLAQVIGSPTVIMFGLGFLSVDALSGFINVFVLAFTCGCRMSLAIGNPCCRMSLDHSGYFSFVTCFQ